VIWAYRMEIHLGRLRSEREGLRKKFETKGLKNVRSGGKCTECE